MLINGTAKLTRLLVTLRGLWRLSPKIVAIVCVIWLFSVGPDVKHMATY